MKRVIENDDPQYGFVWGHVDGNYFVETADGDLKLVNEQVVDLLEKVGTGAITRAKLRAQLEGGEVVVDPESNTSPEAVLEFVERYVERGILREGEPIVRIEPPDDIGLWPRATLVAVLFLFVAFSAVNVLLGLEFERVLQLDLRTLAGVWLVALGFFAVHELGHYLASAAYFDTSIRLDLVNGVVPAVVTDTTGSWLLPRNRRIWINLAGPSVELLAALPLVALSYVVSDSAFLQLVVLMVFVHAFFSLNPLIHGDGYWIVCDLFGLVNVRKRGKEDLAARTLSWRGAYVVLSYGFGALVFLNMTVGTIYVMGTAGLILLLPLVPIFVLSKIDYELTSSTP